MSGKFLIAHGIPPWIYKKYVHKKKCAVKCMYEHGRSLNRKAMQNNGLKGYCTELELTAVCVHFHHSGLSHRREVFTWCSVKTSKFRPGIFFALKSEVFWQYLVGDLSLTPSQTSRWQGGKGERLRTRLETVMSAYTSLRLKVKLTRKRKHKKSCNLY